MKNLIVFCVVAASVVGCGSKSDGQSEITAPKLNKTGNFCDPLNVDSCVMTSAPAQCASTPQFNEIIFENYRENAIVDGVNMPAPQSVNTSVSPSVMTFNLTSLHQIVKMRFKTGSQTQWLVYFSNNCIAEYDLTMIQGPIGPSQP